MLKREDQPLKKNKVSIIIPIYNVSQELVDITCRCINDLRINTKDFELIIIDNASIFRSDYGADLLITNDSNLGVAKAWNQGISAATNNYIVVMNNDISVHPYWLDKLIEAYEVRGNDKIGFAFSTPTEELPGQYRNYLETFAEGQTFGACFLSTKKTYDTIGLFDEQFSPCYYEDFDMWERTRRAGAFLRMTSRSFVTAIGRGTTAKYLPDLDKIKEDNKIKFYSKWPDLKKN